VWGTRETAEAEDRIEVFSEESKQVPEDDEVFDAA